MPRTAIVPQQGSENAPINGLEFVAMDAVNGNTIEHTGDFRDVQLIVRNDGGSAYTFTQSSKTKSSWGRDASAAQKTQSIAAGAYLYISGRDLPRWGLNLDAENSALKIAVTRGVGAGTPVISEFLDDFTAWGEEDPRADLLTYHKCNANVGGLIVDEQGVQDLTIVGSPTFPTSPALIGSEGHYYGPSSGNAYAQGGTSLWNFNATDFSVAFWYYRDAVQSTTNATMVCNGKAEYNSGAGWMIRNDNGAGPNLHFSDGTFGFTKQLEIGLRGTTDYTNSVGTWMFMGVTWETSTGIARAYHGRWNENRMQQQLYWEETDLINADLSNANQARVGASGTATGIYRQPINEVQVYDRLLSFDELSWLYWRTRADGLGL